MQTFHFPERQHPIVQALSHHTDRDLLTLAQLHPDQGRYFVALFCRYDTLVYNLIRHAVRSPVQAEYLFTITWSYIYQELKGVDLVDIQSIAKVKSSDQKLAKSSNTEFKLQSWLTNVTAICINHAKLPPVEEIHYELAEASPPLWYFINQALEELSPLHRLTVLLAQTFHWNPTQISAYLRAEGTRLSDFEVNQVLAQAYRELDNHIPKDIRDIYQFSSQPSQSSQDIQHIV